MDINKALLMSTAILTIYSTSCACTTDEMPVESKKFIGNTFNDYELAQSAAPEGIKLVNETVDQNSVSNSLVLAIN